MKPQALASRRSERGYSLPEMLIVVAIVGIVSLVTIPNFISMYQSSRVKASARTMITDIRNARQLAISASTRVKVSFNTGPGVNTYEVYRENRDRMTGTSTWKRVKRGDLGPVVYINSSVFTDAIADDGGTKDVVFLPNGTVAKNGIEPGVPTESVHIELKTNQKVPKKTYNMKFQLSGSVSLT